MNEKRIEIDVYALTSDSDGKAALIIYEKTGIFYTAQCGGIGCRHPSAEGFFLPIWDLLPDLDECSYGCAELTKSLGFDQPELRARLAEAIDKALPAVCARYSFNLRFDYERIDQLMEGWWPLIITGILHDVGPLDHKCFYHNGNCD